MEDKKKTLSNYRLDKAKEDLHTAELMLEYHKYDQSVNRSYYAMFHAVRALLAFDFFDSKRHSSIIGYFNQKYVANGKIEAEYYKMLARAFDKRMKSDYHDFYRADLEEAKEQLDEARLFIDALKAYIEDHCM
jgi:uncharacterized protein (UPF0332 family)